ncbi:MAG: T9SS type A sorting domain-containing protein, partial [Chitinophagaceae bacterium]|nr:T9SS type A sorting domain-containing protein [Chitinophagaceae bacterium]
YEYYLKKTDSTGSHGYIYAGINEPAIHYRGAMILLVDDAFTNTCSTEIATLMKDLSGDGWKVIRKDFPRTATVATVKSYITATVQADTSVEGVYILGHIAVPYSGELNPDGHSNHIGAWPADAYYGELNGTWTDASVNNTTSANTLNRNTPGDGKFDPSYFPSDIELQVGRVDFYDMPAFSKTEEVLMKSYLNKAHQYKIGALNVIKRGIVDDNFKTYQEGFAGNGWRNISVMVGIDSVFAKDIVTTLNTDFYQWAYGCGGGTYTSCGGVGTTNDIAAGNMKAIFTMFFGSYFGDWNYSNNFLRAPLCANEPSLASFWSGRPNWPLHHMALGETIGYSTRLSQNNYSLYETPIPSLARTVNMALMGDPSLRTEYVKPVPTVLTTANPAAGAVINWTASPEPNVSGYYVYRSDAEFGEYKLRSGLVTGTSYTDSFGTDGTYWYMVRACKLTTTPSGTYYNMSIGTAKSGTFKYPYFDVSVQYISALTEVQVYPNPARESVQLRINSIRQSDAYVTITDIQGRVQEAANITLQTGENAMQFNISNLPAGMYMVNINTGTEKRTVKLAKTY